MSKRNETIEQLEARAERMKDARAERMKALTAKMDAERAARAAAPKFEPVGLAAIRRAK